MKIRKTIQSDLPCLLDIFEKARLFMKATGNPNQWVQGHPPKELLLKDIEMGHSYVCLEENTGTIIGTFYFAVEEDETYQTIYEGQWLNNLPYGVIHRIAAAPGTKGVGSFCIQWCLQQWGNIKIDTHKDNTVMQQVLKRIGFTYCGIIHIPEVGPRVAYQKTLENHKIHTT